MARVVARLALRSAACATSRNSSATNDVGVVIEELPPRKQSAPVHYHLTEEQHILMLDGSATLRLGEEEHELKPTGYVCFPER